MSQLDKAAMEPFLKWAGGKRWLAKYHAHLFPEKFDRYFEPFLGSAAVFFSLRPSRAILSDSNARLIECYRQIRNSPADFVKHLRQHQREHSDDYYYSIREKMLRTPLTRAVQFLYLNRTCWNGLYRVNLNGEFNVPRGTKSSVIFDGESFTDYATALKMARIRCCDYEKAIARATEGDFVFVDPPYTAKHNYNGFLKYNETIFSWRDQVRLRGALGEASKRGAMILLCNAHHESVLDLFGDLGTVHILSRRSTLAGDAIYRADVTEIAMSVNY